jgi:glycosyltransferase involved in cell wall biosynthesis
MTIGHGDGVSAASPLVSLVMPAWNPQREWLREAVASALGQRGCAIELVVVDDGCETPVADLLDGIADDRMRILRVPHGRVSRARNAGIEAARGDYVRFIDCDDVIAADSTAHLLALAGSDDRVVTYGATVVCDASLRPLATIRSRIEGRAAEDCLLNRFDTTIHSLLFPRPVVEEVGPWEPSIVVSQDWDYALRAFERADVRGDERVATYYRIHPRMNSRNVAEGIRGYQLVVERYFDRNPELRGGSLHRRAEALFHLFAAVQLATKLRRYRAAFGHVRHAFALDPVASLSALPRHSAMPFLPAVSRARRLLPARWRRPT